jgi:hypothetical protein
LSLGCCRHKTSRAAGHHGDCWVGRRASAPPWHALPSPRLTKRGWAGGSDWLAAPRARWTSCPRRRLALGDGRPPAAACWAAAPPHPHRCHPPGSRSTYSALRREWPPLWTRGGPSKGSVTRAAWTPFPLCAWDNGVSMTARQSGLRLDISGRPPETRIPLRNCDSSGWIRTTDLTIMSCARGCEPRRRAAPQAHENAGTRGYRERAACARLTGVVLWRRRLVDAGAADDNDRDCRHGRGHSMARPMRLSPSSWSRRSRVRVPSAHPSSAHARSPPRLRAQLNNAAKRLAPTWTVCSPSSSPVAADSAAIVCERLWVSAPSTIINSVHLPLD